MGANLSCSQNEFESLFCDQKNSFDTTCMCREDEEHRPAYSKASPEKSRQSQNNSTKQQFESNQRPFSDTERRQMGILKQHDQRSFDCPREPPIERRVPVAMGHSRRKLLEVSSLAQNVSISTPSTFIVQELQQEGRPQLQGSSVGSATAATPPRTSLDSRVLPTAAANSAVELSTAAAAAAQANPNLAADAGARRGLYPPARVQWAVAGAHSPDAARPSMSCERPGAQLREGHIVHSIF